MTFGPPRNRRRRATRPTGWIGRVVTKWPPRAITRAAASNSTPPWASKTTSYLCFHRVKSSWSWSMTSAAPSASAPSAWASLHTAVTRAPRALAICTAKWPTPVQAPFTRTRFPWTEPHRQNPSSTVSAAVGSAAACSKLSPCGIGCTRLAGTTSRSACAPCSPSSGEASPYTGSPGVNPSTPSPTDITLPAKSAPKTRGNSLPARGRK